MIKFIDKILKEFREAFTRTKSHECFIIIIIGIIIKNDGIGITSIIRELSIDPRYYENLIHFFRSYSWTLEKISKSWAKTIKNNSKLLRIREFNVLIGDGIKVCKEGKKMPGVKKHHQDSENSSRPKYMFGHHFGVVSALCGCAKKQFSIPIKATIQDGVNEIKKFLNPEAEAKTHGICIISDALEIVEILGKSIILLDGYFLSLKMLKKC
jgi:hypothetical protein